MVQQMMVGRTGIDVIANNKNKLFYFFAFVVIIAILWYGSRYMDTETIEAFIIGTLLGWLLTSNIMKPVGRLILVVPPDFDNVRLIFIPEEFYSKFNQTGYPVCSRSFLGCPLYFARNIDLDLKTIEYGWLTEKLPIQVAADRKVFLEWYKKSEEAMIENLKIKSYPMIYGAAKAKEPMQFLSEQLSKYLGFKVDLPEDPLEKPHEDPVSPPPVASSEVSE